MKKALALVLALVLALSLGVSAFALEVVDLGSDVASSKTSKIDLDKNAIIFETDTNENSIKDEKVYVSEGGTYYMLLNENGYNLKDIRVEANGIVSAKVVDFDGSKMTMSGVNFYVCGPDGVVAWVNCDTANAEKNAAKYPCGTYEYAATCVKDMNNKAQVLGKYKVVVGEEDASGVTVKNYKVIELTVEENYGVAYKEGTFVIKATDITDKKHPVALVSEKYTVISDVNIFEYEMVVWAGSEGEALKAYTDKGYSDYATQGNYGEDYNVAALRQKDATVISTTEFRTLREKVKSGIAVESKGLLVELKEVAAGQKGVNFAAYGVTFLTAKGVPTTTRGTAAKVVFGFLGNQTIASDFTITANLGVSAYELREMFGEAVEEEDVITYYVLKDGKVADSFKVDYMKDEVDEGLELEIAGKAGSTLGQYEIVLEAPAAPAEGEENPNTGAESVIGVVAAMAVVSVAAAAAVSLKK